MNDHDGATPAPALRRRPQQERSRDTFNAVLAAARRLVVSHGADSFTVERLAMEAGVAVGSVYRFFPNKHAVLNETGLRSLQALERSVEELAAWPEFHRSDWQGRVDLLVDLVARWSEEEGLPDAFWSAFLPNDELKKVIAASRGRFTSLIAEAIAPHLGSVPKRQRLLVATVATEIISGLVAYAETDVGDAGRIFGEAKLAVRSYLEAATARGGSDGPMAKT